MHTERSQVAESGKSRKLSSPFVPPLVGEKRAQTRTREERAAGGFAPAQRLFGVHTGFTHVQCAPAAARARARVGEDRTPPRASASRRSTVQFPSDGSSRWQDSLPLVQSFLRLRPGATALPLRASPAPRPPFFFFFLLLLLRRSFPFFLLPLLPFPECRKQT